MAIVTEAMEATGATAMIGRSKTNPLLRKISRHYVVADKA